MQQRFFQILPLLMFAVGFLQWTAVPPKAKKKKKIVIIAGGCTHGPMTHEYRAGSLIIAKALEESIPGKLDIAVYDKGWPEDINAFKGVDAIVMYLDGGGGHLAMPHLKEVDSMANRGVGIACLHFAVEMTMKQGPYLLNWIGGYFEVNWSVNPYWLAQFTELPKHPITRGVKPFEARDEWYYHMRFREDMKGVTPILSVVPPASTLTRPDGPHENNPHVRAAAGQPQQLAWASERKGGGRGFGFTGGHSHRNWANDDFRKLVLNGIAWTAKISIPENGLTSLPVSQDELKNNLDPKPCAVKPK